MVMTKTELKGDKMARHIIHRKSDYSALSAVREIQKNDQDEYQKNLASNYNEFELDNFKLSELKNGSPITMEYDLTKDFEDEDIIYLQPIFQGSILSNPFQREERTSVIDFPYAQSYKVISQIIVPEGYKTELPEGANVALPNQGGSFVYNVSQTGNMISIVSQVNINQTYFTPNEYPALKQFYQIVTDKNQELVVLSK